MVAVVVPLNGAMAGMFVQLTPLNTCHWYVSGPVPLAATVKVAVPPAHTVLLVGCVVTAGAVFTVIVVVPDVTEGLQVPLTTARYT